MEIFLVISAGLFFVAGTLFMLSPKSVMRIYDMTNKALFTLDDKIPKLRRPLGIFFLSITIFLWYILLYKIYKY